MNNYMTQQQLKALNNVVDYLFSDELKSYEEDGKPENHIFLDVQTLDDLTKDYSNTAHRLKKAKETNCEKCNKGWPNPHNCLKNHDNL